MVRRWSYLNSIRNGIFDTNSKSLDASIDNHAFKVFKKTTFFRKYNRGITSFVRRKNILRKRKTNNIILNYITAKWVTFYIRARRLYRYVQSSHIFSVSRAIASVDAFSLKSKNLGFLTGAIITTIPNKASRSPIVNKFPSSRNAIAYLPSDINKQDSPLINTLFNSYISYNHNFYNLLKFNPNDLINSVSLTLYKQAIASTLSVRSIITMCALLNIFK